jgi:hypothetical protein
MNKRKTTVPTVPRRERRMPKLRGFCEPNRVDQEAILLIISQSGVTVYGFF